MAEGFASGIANQVLNTMLRGATWTPPTNVYVQLHTGAPGSAGTANVATETDRVQGTFGTNASGGAISNTAALTWTGVAGSEDYTHFTVWDASTSGTFLFSGAVTANAVTSGDDFTIATGDLDVSIPVAS